MAQIPDGAANFSANRVYVSQDADDLPIDADHDAGLAERRYLHDAIGKAGLMALKPLQVTSWRDRWHRHLLRRSTRLSG